MIFFNQSYTALSQDSCLCRNNNATTNCTCCSTQRPAGPVAPTCPANFTEVLPSCVCQSGVNGTQICDCSRVSGSVESYFPNITARACNCIPVRQNGQDIRQCQCCASTAQLATPQPVCATSETVEQCSCSANFDCDCRYRNTNYTLGGLRRNASTCGCPNNNATSKACGCCVSFENLKDALTPSCSNNDVLGLCQCTNTTTVVNRVTRVTQRCNCTGELRSERGTIMTNTQSMNVTPSSCGGSYNESGRAFQRCCVPDTVMAALPVRQCRVADQVNATCSFFEFASNATSRIGSCIVPVNRTTFNFNPISVNSTNCSCNEVISMGRVGARCNCCLPKQLVNATLLRTPGTCNATTSSAQQCNCRATGDSNSFTCDCNRRVGNTQSTRNGVFIERSQCSCLNQTVNGNNFGDCQCCVPNPPPTQCELLAQPRPSNLRCKCAYVVTNGVSDFKCDCNSVVNYTYSISRRNLSVNESSCCCVELSDPLTRKGYKACNCTQPPVVQTQNCQCKAVQGARNSTRVNCDCSNC